MATKNFKGFQLVTKAQFEALGANKDLNTLYFVRTNEGKTDGFLYFNGKKYGTAEDAKAAVLAKFGDLGDKTVEAYVNDKIAEVTTAATTLEGKVTANTKAIETINGDETVDGSFKKAVKDAKTALVGAEDTVDTIKHAEKLANDAAAAATAEKKRAEGVEAQLRTDVDAKVKSVEGTDTVVATTTEHAVSVSLKTSDKGNVKFTQDADGLSANVTIPAATVTGVKADDKFLSLVDKLVSADVSIEYDNTDKKIYLYGKDKTKANAVSSIDCTDFIKDGMLDGSALYTATAATGTVTINTNEYNLTGLTANHAYIVLVWNTDAKKDAMAIDVTSLIDIYTAKADGGLKLEEHAFSVDTAKIATVDSVNGVTTRVTTLEGKVGSETSGLIKDVADNKAAIATLNGDEATEGSVNKKIKDALDAGAVTLKIDDNDPYLGVTATTGNNGTVYTLASKADEINKAIDAVKVTVADGTYVKGSVDAAGRAITLSETVQEVAASSASKKGLAEASDVKDYVDKKVSGKNVSATGDTLVSASATDNKVTVAATEALTTAVAHANSAVQSVNGVQGTAVTLKATDIEVGAAVGGGQAATAKVDAVLADIYTKLGVVVKADGKTIKEADDHTLSVNLETKENAQAAGHVALEHGKDGALYGVMYYSGDDAE